MDLPLYCNLFQQQECHNKMSAYIPQKKQKEHHPKGWQARRSLQYYTQVRLAYAVPANRRNGEG